MAVTDRARTVSQTRQPERPGGTGAKGAAGLGVALALVATVVWSGSFVATSGMADSVPPIQAVFWRWVIAAVAVAPSPPARPGPSGPCSAPTSATSAWPPSSASPCTTPSSTRPD